MKRTAPLNAAQLAVLRWVEQGSPVQQTPNPGYKNTALALHHRGLVQVSRKGGVWRATLTADGLYYLQHGSHRPRPAPVAPQLGGSHQPPPSPLPLPAIRSNGAVGPSEAGGGKAAALVQEIVDAGGRLLTGHHERPNLTTLVTAANRFDKVPAGTQLMQTWTRDGIVLHLAPACADVVRVPVPAQLRRPHPAVAALLPRDSGYPIIGPARGRSLRLMHALAREAERRGHTVRGNRPVDVRDQPVSTSRRKGIVTISVGDHTVGVAVTQQHDKTPHVPTASELRDAERYSWVRIPQWDKVPTERLTLSLDAPHKVKQDRWHDSSRASLDDVLHEVLAEIERRCAAAAAAQREREREAEQRRHRWEAAMQTATEQYAHSKRVDHLNSQVARWRASRDLAAYLDAMAERCRDLTGEERAAADAWLTFARGHHTALDPLHRDLADIDVPAPSRQELQPFLNGWSPYGPD